jgi:hypothetical protein
MEDPMPYALYCDDARISKAYPTAASVWQHACESGLVIDVEPKDSSASPRQILDNGYEIRSCEPEPGENPERNEQDAQAQRDVQLKQDAA